MERKWMAGRYFSERFGGSSCCCLPPSLPSSLPPRFIFCPLYLVPRSLSPLSLPSPPSRSLLLLFCSLLVVFSQSPVELFFCLESAKSSLSSCPPPLLPPPPPPLLPSSPPSPLPSPPPPTSSGPLTGHANGGQGAGRNGRFPPQAPPPSQPCLNCLHSQCKPHPSVARALLGGYN